MKRVAGILALVVFGGVLAAAGGTKAYDTVNCTDLTMLNCAEDAQWAQDLEARIADNIWDGQVYEIDYATPERNPGQVTGVGAFADSALWTGTYLASQSFRYSLAKKNLASNPTDAFWLAQRSQAQSRIKDMVRKFNMLVNISRYWNHELELNPQQAGFGGGIIRGEPGYLMRACIDRTTIDANPTGAIDPGEDPSKPDFYGWSSQELDPAPRNLPPPYTSKRRVFGPFPWDGKQYFCEDGTSRDAYAGTIFGLLVAFDLYTPDDPALRTQIRNNIVTLANFARKYLWTTPRPHGQISIPIDSNHDGATCSQINALLDVCGHDFENFWSPLFAYTPTAQMEVAQAARHVTLKAPGHKDTLKWYLNYNAELQATGPFLWLSHLVDTVEPYDSYYKWNLEHLITYNLIRQAPNAVAKEYYRLATAVMDATTGNDVNAHFEAVMYAVTGETPRLNAAIQHLREWRDYYARIHTNPVTNHQPRCGVDLDCVPKDQKDAHAVRGADPIVIPGIETGLRAHHPLPVDERTPTDFLWQRPPNQLCCGESLNHQAPGIDYLLPYWMIRYLTEVNTPAATPLVPWLGPSFD